MPLRESRLCFSPFIVLVHLRFEWKGLCNKKMIKEMYIYIYVKVYVYS